ncbi:hypothetical protein [Coraliomargarita parva]|uniref:hypothetical protein n=1 Tax=Coraliomargarita parva TaxID=3014050 RepID=UPI0022B305BF|nr:hypothetical protein [Coraliomargarita parva]
MDLTDTQKAAVKTWINEGKSIADVQRLLREDFSISMTYMDVRFLVDDLDISFAEVEAQADAVKEADESEKDAETVEPELVDAGGNGTVSVEVDQVMRPGALVSGTVIFSDGVKLGWQLNSGGQLGLIPGDDPEYRPSPEDVQEFQVQLQSALQQQGF